MRKLSLLFILSLVAVTCLASEAIDKGVAGASLITLDGGTEIHIFTSDNLEFAAQQIVSDRSTGRTELRGDVRLTVFRNGVKLLEVETGHAVVTRRASNAAE